MDPWQTLGHPCSSPKDRWWLVSANPKSLNYNTFEEALKIPDVRAIVVMYYYNSSAQIYWRCFVWLGDGQRYMNLLQPKPYGYFVGWSAPGFSATTLFGDEWFWLILPSPTPKSEDPLAN